MGQGWAAQSTCGTARNYAVFTAAGVGAAAAAGGGLTMRIMGYNVPYPAVLGTALAAAEGVYLYECLAVKHEKEGPLKSYLEASPHIRSLELTNQDGKPFTAKDLFGKFAVITFGTTQSTDVNSVATVAKATEMVKQRSGTAVTPVFITLDPKHDKPAELKRLVQSVGAVDLVALTGDPDGLLACANKYKRQEISARATASRDQESIKRANTVDESYVSSYVFVVNPNGDYVSMISKDLPSDKMANQICLSI
ncbi:hypothetical protein N2152v2_009754 [Parachlorella kessleri]